ncbi:ankyrin repeat and SOCS box protein 12-like isoform X2 [Eleutherodactylus coqui]|uniref:ankyrin repeat and SOCS box protein 12-like isoform X2 n=1 Tax=Eleutherodactylus coqui TaxID=57060 RepID=UPI0034635B46
MAGFLSSIKELVLHRKACTLIRACKEEELRALLSENEAKKLIRKTSGNVLRRCLQVAIDKQYMGCIEELLKAGANPRILLDSCSVPSIVYGQGNVRLLQLLLEYGASEDSCKAAGTADGTSVLGMCLKRNYEAPFVELLIQFGANIYLPHIQKALLEVDNDATRLLDREKAHPRSLKSQCRIAIRRWLIQVGKLRLIDQIDIPDQLEKYLQYHNEFDDIKKLPRCYQRFTYPIAEHLLFGAGCNYEQEQKYL